MKGPLQMRPIYVKTKEHIRAHLFICIIALTMIRMIQREYLLKNPPAPNDIREWTYDLSEQWIQMALQLWKTMPMKEGSD